MARVLIVYGTTEGQTAKIAAHIADAGRRLGREVVACRAAEVSEAWLKRMLMRRIAQKEGGDVDTSRDFEYTDWDQVTRFAERFFGLLARGPELRS